MSFDIYLQCCKNGETVNIDRSAYQKHFGASAARVADSLWRAFYPDGGADIYAAPDSAEFSCIMFNHCGGHTFYAKLFQLADETGSVVYWHAEGRAMAVTDPQVIPHLDPDMAEALGPPFIVRSADALQGAILEGIDPEDTGD